MLEAGRKLILLGIAVACAGCGGNANTAVSPATHQPRLPSVLGDPTLTAIGELQLTDSLARAKQLFPVPAGAEVTSEPEMTLQGETHYGWSGDKLVLDAFASATGLTTVSFLKKNLTDAQRQTEIDLELERFDEPTENAEGQTTAAYLWRDGDYVRIVVDFFGGQSKGILKVTGTAAALEARGFPLSNLADLVAAFDESAVQ